MFRRKPGLVINDRIIKLLKDVRAQSIHREDALNTFIDESLKRIDRVCRISNEHNADELKYKFLTQLEGVVHDRKKFFSRVFKTKSKDSKAIDYDAFRNYMTSVIPLLSPDGPISQAEDTTYCKKCINERIEKLIEKQNAYVGDALTVFINDKFPSLENECTLMQLDDDASIDVQTVFIERLERFNFSGAYTRYGYQHRSQKFERDEMNPFDIKYQSFDQMVSKAISFQRPDDFISQVLNIPDQKERFIRAVNEIENEIKKYSGSNKINIVSQFESKMKIMKNSFSDTMKREGFFKAAAEAKKEIGEILSKIQNKENKYYRTGLFGGCLSFFSGYCQSNSSLQPKINKAMEAFEGIQIGAEKANSAKLR
ncbi:hypothetical protein AQUSIP_06990 [Aquicella siphonis]|uniref:Uncharacterized protein n=1 Tax=Aquicella siphonis TaxID=254247 RepID=A0A5E4PEJ8_9COXI|nr:hypothetical protein [Aquicella siphonis]VVC75409.1 hypothetical protein AQUSIP_06990 [Aquicella siphonis]